jgi:hypothetical protein
MANALHHFKLVDQVDYGQHWGMLIDHMYNECMTLVWYDLFLYYLYTNWTYKVDKYSRLN